MWILRLTGGTKEYNFGPFASFEAAFDFAMGLPTDDYTLASPIRLDNPELGPEHYPV